MIGQRINEEMFIQIALELSLLKIRLCLLHHGFPTLCSRVSRRALTVLREAATLQPG